jgi:O-antigen/teichoic acid export membrane protein
MANIFLGIYYNLSIWYKLTNRNLTGAFITAGGALITIVLTIWLIPVYHYWGAALASFGCYLFMVISSYWLGQKHYPVPYETGRIMFYLLICIGFYRAHRFLVTWSDSRLYNLATATAFLLLFVWIISRAEKKEWKLMLASKK